MECNSAAELLSTAHDGPVSAEELRLANEHCNTCEQCAAFRDMLARVDSVPAPKAPPDLVSRLVTLGAETAAGIRNEQAGREAALDLEPVPTPEPSTVKEPWFARWTPRLTAYVAAAAVLLVAIGITTASILGSGGSRQAAETGESGVSSDALEEAPAAPEYGGEKDQAATGGEAEAAAPPYVTLSAGVWLLAGPASPAPSTLTTAGVIVSSLADPGSPGELTAFWTAPSSDTLYVRAADGQYIAFERVVRTLGRSPYQLQSGAALPQYGLWPTLPRTFTQPTEADGSPTFQFFGVDDLGVDVYVPVGGRIEDGLAVPPGTAPDDPAAGNPGWTWWEPLD